MRITMSSTKSGDAAAEIVVMINLFGKDGGFHTL
jgi:hypothetical protein